MRATLQTDGAARRKLAEPTGPAGIGAVLRSESGEVVREIARGIGVATNNFAQYTALIEGLQLALDAHLLKGTGSRQAVGKGAWPGSSGA